ncbi:DUF4998 domain-containing protein [Parapedobacter sp. 2B3]
MSIEMKNNFPIVILLLAGCASLGMLACERHEDTYAQYLEGGERIYPARVDSLRAFPGKNRVGLQWLLVSDPNIVECMVYWDFKSDSLSIPINRREGIDTVNVIIDELPEDFYTFEIFTRNSEGQISLKSEINTFAYGEQYINSLSNRTVRAATYRVDLTPSGDLAFGGLSIEWYDAADEVVEVEIGYTDENGHLVTITDTLLSTEAPEDQNMSTLPSYQLGTNFSYRTGYKPLPSALDVVYTPYEDGYTNEDEIPNDLILDKQRFRTALLWGDITGANFGGDLAKLWNNSAAVGDWYHSATGEPFPHMFTVDLGVEAILSSVRLYPRIECCYDVNPKVFEFWGISDTTNAVPSLPGSDPNWKQEALDKGWTLLKREVRTNPDEASGNAPIDVTIPSNIAVRFVRYRVEETYSNTYTHLTEWDIRASGVIKGVPTPTGQ